MGPAFDGLLCDRALACFAKKLQVTCRIFFYGTVHVVLVLLLLLVLPYRYSKSPLVSSAWLSCSQSVSQPVSLEARRNYTVNPSVVTNRGSGAEGTTETRKDKQAHNSPPKSLHSSAYSPMLRKHSPYQAKRIKGPRKQGTGPSCLSSIRKAAKGFSLWLYCTVYCVLQRIPCTQKPPYPAMLSLSRAVRDKMKRNLSLRKKAAWSKNAKTSRAGCLQS